MLWFLPKSQQYVLGIYLKLQWLDWARFHSPLTPLNSLILTHLSHPPKLILADLLTISPSYFTHLLVRTSQSPARRSPAVFTVFTSSSSLAVRLLVGVFKKSAPRSSSRRRWLVFSQIVVASRPHNSPSPADLISRHRRRRRRPSQSETSPSTLLSLTARDLAACFV